MQILIRQLGRSAGVFPYFNPNNAIKQIQSFIDKVLKNPPAYKPVNIKDFVEIFSDGEDRYVTFDDNKLEYVINGQLSELIEKLSFEEKIYMYLNAPLEIPLTNSYHNERLARHWFEVDMLRSLGIPAPEPLVLR